MADTLRTPRAGGSKDPPLRLVERSGARVMFAMVAAVLLGSSLLVGAQNASKVNVTGKWMFQVETSAGSGTPTVTFKQDGEKLTGHYSSTNLGEAELTGTVKGTVIQFSFVVDVQGMKIDVAYSGAVENNDAMNGTVTLGGVGEGKFTGKRQ